MNFDGLNGIIALLFGAGGATALATGVAAWRNYRSGKISDDESIIKRLYAELTRKDSLLKTAEDNEQAAVDARRVCEERALKYRLQIIQLGGTPYDERNQS